MRCILAIGVVLAGCSGAQAQAPGEWVLARWKGGQHWFPGIVQKAWGNRFTIQFDDGETETLNLTHVRRYDWTVGSKVECNFKGRGWYAGKITGLAGERLCIAYEDGDREATRTALCRSS